MTGPTKFPPPRFYLRKPAGRPKAAEREERKRADHRARKRDAEWRAYQASWQRPINELKCTAEAFYNLRRNVLVLNRKQTARLLRVGVTSVLNWETGVHPVPFYAYLALQLVSESKHYQLANYAWRDWEFIERVTDSAFAKEHQKYVNELINRKTGAHFTPDELDYIHFQIQRLAALDSEAAKLRGKVGELTRENTEIRELYRTDGLTSELHDVRKRVDALLGRINTAAVVPIRRAAA